MSNRHVFSGHNAQDQPIWAAMELHLREKEVLFHLVPKQGLSAEATQQLQETWVSGADYAWPEGTEELRHSAEAESILPDEVKADQPEMLRRVQNEWTLKLLSFKLYESINDEVTNLQAGVQQATGYSQEVWDKAKKIWDQVGNHAQDFNLSKKHTGELRDRINGLFTELKKRREEGQDQLAEASAALKIKYEESLKGIQSAMAEGNAKVNQLFDRLKSLQKEIKEASLTHRDRRKLWKDLDGTFNTLKSEKQQLYHSHLSNRIAGLQKAIDRMQHSIDRDRKQIDWEAKKLDHGRIGQLEHQLRQTRLKVTEDRIKSKEEKLADMHRTMQNLQKKEAQQKKAEEKAKQKAEAAEAAKAEAAKAAAAPADEAAAAAGAAPTADAGPPADAAPPAVPAAPKVEETPIADAAATEAADASGAAEAPASTEAKALAEAGTPAQEEAGAQPEQMAEKAKEPAAKPEDAAAQAADTAADPQANADVAEAETADADADTIAETGDAAKQPEQSASEPRTVGPKTPELSTADDAASGGTEPTEALGGEDSGDAEPDKA